MRITFPTKNECTASYVIRSYDYKLLTLSILLFDEFIDPIDLISIVSIKGSELNSNLKVTSLENLTAHTSLLSRTSSTTFQVSNNVRDKMCETSSTIYHRLHMQ
jgi:hypothetical protein